MRRSAMAWKGISAAAPATSTSSMRSRPRRLRPERNPQERTAMATTITKTETRVGNRIRRREDPRLITGTATYVDDIQKAGMHHDCVLRSTHGAAERRSDE